MADPADKSVSFSQYVTNTGWVDRDIVPIASTVSVLGINSSGTLTQFTNFTQQGNTFNGASQLLQLNGSGIVALANLGTGSATSSTYLRGDSTWATVPQGTVTSITATGANGIGITGSPISASGTLAFSLGAITPTSVSTGSTGFNAIASGGVNIGATADPGLGKLSLGTGNTDPYAATINITASQHATSRRASIGWGGFGVGQDLLANGTKDFYFYDQTNSSTRLYIGATGGVNIGAYSDPGAGKLVVQTTGDDTVPSLGSAGGKLRLLNSGGLYGLIFGTISSGNSFIQSQRVDGTATAYVLNLQPNGGGLTIGGSVTVGGSIITSQPNTTINGSGISGNFVITGGTGGTYLNNNANSLSNLSIFDNGNVTARQTLTAADHLIGVLHASSFAPNVVFEGDSITQAVQCLGNSSCSGGTPNGYNNYMGAAAGANPDAQGHNSNFTAAAIGTANGIAVSPTVGQNVAVAGKQSWELYETSSRVNNLYRNEALNILVYLAGTNDMGVGSYSASQTYEHIAASLKHFRLLGWKIVLVGLISRGDGVVSDASINSVNGLLRQNWAELADRFVDWGIVGGGTNEFFNTAGGGSGGGTWYNSDRLHPSYAGSRKLAQYIVTYINDLLTYYFQKQTNQLYVNYNTTTHNSNFPEGGLTINNENPSAGISTFNWSFAKTVAASQWVEQDGLSMKFDQPIQVLSGTKAPSTGTGLALYYSSGTDYSHIQSYRWDATQAWKPLILEASQIKFSTNSVSPAHSGDTLILFPTGGANLGGATDPAVAGSLEVGSMNIRASANYNASGVSVVRVSDNSNTCINPVLTSGAVYLNWDRGTGGYGTIFGDGASGTKGRISAAGGLTLGAGVDAGLGNILLYVADEGGLMLRQSNNSTYGIDFVLDQVVDGALHINRVVAGTSTIAINLSRATGGVNFGGYNDPGGPGKLALSGSNQSLIHFKSATDTSGWGVGRAFSNNNVNDFWIYNVLDARAAPDIGISAAGGVNIAGTADAGAGNLWIRNSSGNNNLIVQAASGSTTFKLLTYADNSACRNWAFRNRYNQYGTLELMRSTDNSSDPLTIVATFWTTGGLSLGTGGDPGSANLLVKHYGGMGTAPTVAVGTQIGTGGSVALGTGSTDSSGYVAITTGTGPAVGDQATVTFGTAYTVAPFAVFTGGSTASALVHPAATTSTTTFQVYFASAPAASTTYYVFYIVQGN